MKGKIKKEHKKLLNELETLNKRDCDILMDGHINIKNETEYNILKNNIRELKTSSKQYRRICFSHYYHSCVSCGEWRIVQVHHIDNNNQNNNINNLIPLCPTCHSLIHKEWYKQDIIDNIEKNINKKIVPKK